MKTLEKVKTKWMDCNFVRFSDNTTWPRLNPCVQPDGYSLSNRLRYVGEGFPNHAVVTIPRSDSILAATFLDGWHALLSLPPRERNARINLILRAEKLWQCSRCHPEARKPPLAQAGE